MSQITISIEFNHQQLDYRIPTAISFSRLVELFHEVFLDMKLPEKWTLQLRDKQIQVDESDLIADLPIGNGDVFFIVPSN